MPVRAFACGSKVVVVIVGSDLGGPVLKALFHYGCRACVLDVHCDYTKCSF